jgi:hypothetical protein
MTPGVGARDVAGAALGGVVGAPATVTFPPVATFSSGGGTGFATGRGLVGRFGSGFAATRGGGRRRSRPLDATVSLEARRGRGVVCDTDGSVTGPDDGWDAGAAAGFGAGAEAGLDALGAGFGADRQADKSNTLAMATSR